MKRERPSFRSRTQKKMRPTGTASCSWAMVGWSARTERQPRAARESLRDSGYLHIFAGVVHRVSNPTGALRYEQETLMQNFFKDFSYAIRMLAKYPGFTAVAVLTLALGIGANTAIFSFVNAALLRPLPYASPERLYVLREPREQLEEVDVAVSYPDFQDWRRAAKSFESLAGYTPYSLTMSGGSAPEGLDVARVTPDFFPTLGVSPVLGRDFEPADDQAQGSRVVILSHEFWKSHYGN